LITKSMPRPRYKGDSERRSNPLDASEDTGWRSRGIRSTAWMRGPPMSCEMLRSSALLSKTGERSHRTCYVTRV
jgi:hypothetical protein